MAPLALASIAAGITPEVHAPGQLIGRYQLGHRLGQGASSAVYAAWDPQLGRPVAIKLLRPDTVGTTGSSAEKARLRLQREAQAIARLSHPHVISVYDVGVHEDEVYVVMELVDGGTVRTWLAAERRAWRDILDVFLAAGRGLVAAHAADLVHRDFKPDNVLIGLEGRVRVADFGLARDTGTAARVHPGPPGGLGPPSAPALEGESRPEPGAAPFALSLTQTGALVGTPTYMAPEQFLGAATDARTDQFSFCVTLYQALYGELPFGAGSLQELASRVVAGKLRPPPRKNSVPRWILPILQRGLATLPEDRFPSLEALLTALDPRRVARRRYGRAGAVVLVLLAGSGLVYALGHVHRDARRGHDWEPRPRGAPLRRKLTTAGDITEAAISSDGKTLAYVRDGQRLLLRALDPAGSGTGEREVFQGFGISRLRWSPWGDELLYSVSFDPEKGGQWLLTGATPRRLGAGTSATWAPDGERFARADWGDTGITMTRVKDGTKAVLPLAGSYEWITDMAWSPAGERLLIETQHNDRFTLWTLHTGGRGPERLLEEAYPCAPLWSRQEGAFYYLRKRLADVDLMKARIDPLSGRLAGPVEMLLSGLDIAQGPDYFTWVSLSLSRSGRQLVYTKTTRHSNLWLVSIKTQGRERIAHTTRLTSETTNKLSPRLSPDEKTLAFASEEGGARNLFTMLLAGGGLRQLTFFRPGETRVGPLGWSPDGQEIAFLADEGGHSRVWHVAVDGGTPRPFAHSEASSSSDRLEWTPGAKILYPRSGNRNFHLLDPKSEGEQPLVDNETVGWLFEPIYAPDGTRVVASWTRPKEGGSMLWLLSLSDRGQRPLGRATGLIQLIGWSADGQWIYLQRKSQTQGKSELVRVSATSGALELWLTVPFMRMTECTGMTTDGLSFICAVEEGESDAWLVEDFDAADAQDGSQEGS